MNESWFFSENFGELPDDFFDDALKDLDIPLDNVEQSDLVGDWEAKFQDLELPSSTVLTGIPCGIHDESSNCASKVSGTSSIADNKSPQLKEHSSEAKYLQLPRTSSPVSVLESSSSCSAESSILHYLKHVSVKRPRSKLSRSKRQSFSSITPLRAYDPRIHLGPLDSESESYIEAKMLNSAWRKQMKKKNQKQLPSYQEEMRSYARQPAEVRKCTHCEVTKTPQWREGPNGPKTLCNACGVRYRSGRLLPEYRPAASPTFVPLLHSNSHRKVLEMRKQVNGSTHIGS